MRLAVRTCYDFLRSHQRNRETTFSELSEPETDWLDRFVSEPESASENADAARLLIERLLEKLSPAGRFTQRRHQGIRSTDRKDGQREVCVTGLQEEASERMQTV